MNEKFTTLEGLAEDKLIPALKGDGFDIKKIGRIPLDHHKILAYKLVLYGYKDTKKEITMYIFDKSIIDSRDYTSSLNEFLNFSTNNKKRTLILTNSPNEIENSLEQRIIKNNKPYVIGFSNFAGHELAEDYIKRLFGINN